MSITKQPIPKTAKDIKLQIEKVDRLMEQSKRLDEIGHSCNEAVKRLAIHKYSLQCALTLHGVDL